MAAHPRPRRAFAPLLAVAAACLTAVSASAPAASSNLVVDVAIPSATQITATTCATGAAAVAFGTVLPGTNAISPSDCSVTFGSSNDSATLLLSQQDASGDALSAIATPALDTVGFGAGTGKVTAPVGPGSIYARPSAVGADGSIFIATYRNPTVAGDPFTVTKLQPNGTVDGTYGTAGTADITVGTGLTATRGLAVQADGKAVLVGYSNYGAGRGYDWVVARLTTSGAPDPTFGTGGVVTITHSTSSDYANSVLVRPDGKIVVAGQSWDTGSATYHKVFTQLLPSGALDPAFGTNGIARRDVATEVGATDADAWKLALQQDGKIVYVGPVWRGAVPDIGLGRLDRAGRWDTTFDGDGFREYGPTAYDNPVDLTLDASGRPIVIWTSRAANDDTSIMRFNTDGSVDTTWNANAPVTLDLGGVDTAGAIRMDRSGNVVAISAGTLGGPQRQQVVIRRLPTGAPDTTFGGANGYVGTLIGDSLDKPSGILDVDGHIVTTGHTRVAARDVIYAARFPGRQVRDWAAGRTWQTGTSSMFATCLRATANVTPVWTVDANNDCTAVDTDAWRAVPSASSTSSRVASTASAQVGTAHLRFGLRIVTSEPQGAFQAPLSFSVVAPAI